LWIADTVATVHMIPHRNGLVNLKKFKDSGTMGNRTQEAISEISDVVGMIHNEKETKRVRIQNVKILKNGRFNLFSNSQMLKKAWNFTGNNNYIAIKKEDI
jgi:hypothetical protein